MISLILARSTSIPRRGTMNSKDSPKVTFYWVRFRLVLAELVEYDLEVFRYLSFGVT